MADPIARYQRLLLSQPHNQTARWQLAVSLEKQGHWAEAYEQWHILADAQPESVAIALHLIESCLHTNQWPEAFQHLTNWSKQAPNQPRLWLLLATYWRYQGNAERNHQALSEVLKLEPHNIEALYEQAKLAQAEGHWPEAIAALQQLQKRLAAHPNAYMQAMLSHYLASCHRQLGQVEQAVTAWQQSANYMPLDGPRIAQAMLLPSVYQSTAEIHDWRQRLSHQVTQLQSQQLSVHNLFSEMGTTPFLLGYQGLNDATLNRQIATLIGSCLPPFEGSLNPNPTKKMRLGVFSNYFYQHSSMAYFAGLIQGLDRNQFEIFLLTQAGRPHDHVTQTLKKQADKWLELPYHLPIACQQVQDLHLQVLLYTDVLSDLFSYLLASYRLAPCQAVLPGNPITSGIATLDYFISSVLWEPPNAAKAYTEQLVCLPALPVCYTKPPPAENPQTPFDMPATSHWYVCPMNLLKIHPDFDGAIGGIFAADPKAKIVFFCYKDTPLHQGLEQRFERTVPTSKERIRFVPWQDYQGLMAILSQADVILDTFHCGGGQMAYLALAAGTPMVTWPGPFLRGRMTQSLNQALFLPELIAADWADYVNKAVAVASDRFYQQQLRQHISTHKTGLWNQTTGIIALQEWLLEQGEE